MHNLHITPNLQLKPLYQKQRHQQILTLHMAQGILKHVLIHLQYQVEAKTLKHLSCFTNLNLNLKWNLNLE